MLVDLWAVNESTTNYSYASGLVNGTVTMNLTGNDGVGQLDESSTRTQSQLQCPTKPNEMCAGATTFSRWDPGTWYFGSARTLPSLRALIDIPDTPTDVVLEWRSPKQPGTELVGPHKRWNADCGISCVGQQWDADHQRRCRACCWERCSGEVAH